MNVKIRAFIASVLLTLIICPLLTLGAINLNLASDKIDCIITKREDSFQWSISPNPPAATAIQIIFQKINIDIAELRIYDSIDASGPSLLSCVYCGSTIPPPFTSTTGSIYISARGTPAVNFRSSSFTLTYVAIFSSPNLALASIDVILNMGYAKITPFLANGLIPANTLQRWLISETANSLITFSFSSFNLGSDCQAYIEIYDDSASTNLVFRGCTNKDRPFKWLYSHSGNAVVVLRNPTSNNLNSTFSLTYTTDTTLWECGAYTSPDVMTDLSMVLFDGTKSTDYMRRGDSCSWLISTSVKSPVTLLLRWVSLKTGGTVVVYDNSKPSGYVLWNGVGPTLTVPPPITSTGSALYVVFTSDTRLADGFYGFRGEYMSNYKGSIGIGSGNSLLSMSSAIDIVPPGSGEVYTPNNTYVWYVSPSNSKGPITFIFSNLSLSNPGDKLIIFDGPSLSSPILNTFTGSNTPNSWFFSSTNVATMKFTSNQDKHSIGNFKLSYFSDGPNYHCGFTTNPALLTAPSMILTDGSTSTDLLYPSNYCEWNIQPPLSTFIVIFFTRYDVMGGSLNIFIGPVADARLYVSISNNKAIPAPIIIPYNSAGLSYTSTSSGTGYGFSASYFGISPSNYAPGDGILRLYCSSAISLVNFNSLGGDTAGGMSYWQINPKRSTGAIYFSFSSFVFNGDSFLEIYDGLDASTKLIGRYNKTHSLNVTSWIRTSNTSAFLKHYSEDLSSKFDLTFYSDGPNSHCGFSLNPANLTSSSMIFTDGSKSTSTMYANQDCRWIINPKLASHTLVLEFLTNDVTGGEVRVYDGTSSSDELLWKCISCALRPHPIVSKSGSLFVWYRSYSSGSFGLGFKALYWTLSVPPSHWQSQSRIFSLDMPPQISLSGSISNKTATWNLGISKEISRLQFSPRVKFSALDTEINSLSTDGRPQNGIDIFKSITDVASTCGTLMSDSSSYLIDTSITLKSTQMANRFLVSSSSNKRLMDASGSWDLTKNDSSNIIFHPSETCKYSLNSGSTSSISISIKSFVQGTSGRLRIYTGIYGNDRLEVDSRRDGSSFGSHILAPCGKATIILEYNRTYGATIDYGLDIQYLIREGDTGQDCLAYIQSLQPVIIEEDPYRNVYIGCGVAGGVLILCLWIYIFRKKYPQYQCKPPKSYQRVTPNYPRYSPKLDEWKNKFLPHGRCCVCSEQNIKVFRLSCNHGLCLEDIKSYLDSALGDISMFPVKCPMHYEGCPGIIEAVIAKRVMTEVMYTKFIDFSDRAIYGEGMRCIYCNNFVNFPTNSKLSMVECPYCVQRFCIRCKKPWHYGAKCPMETVDDDLESWKKSSGAQKCPTCQKLIEKDDPNTCNHMVHKITDGIPCIRDRSDFCYLCGEEVAQDYPHDEIGNPGVNHFPDGVFQKCRIIAQRERDAERERLKRLRRLKNKTILKSPIKTSSVAVTSDPDPELPLTPQTNNSSNTPLNMFDSAWDETLVINSSNNNTPQRATRVQADNSNPGTGGASSQVQSPATQRPVVGNLRQPTPSPGGSRPRRS